MHVLCSCIYVTCRGWHILETQWHAFAYVSLTKWHVLEIWWCALAYMSLVVGDIYWRCSIMNQKDSSKADLGFFELFVGSTKELSDLGFGHCAHSAVLFHIYHSSWVVYTRVMVVCSCIYVTRCGWHILESWWCALAYMLLTVGGIYWIHGGVLLHICHSSWMAYTGFMVVCSCIYVTCRVWHILESQQCALAYMSLAMDGIYQSHSSMLVHVTRCG